MNPTQPIAIDTTRQLVTQPCLHPFNSLINIIIRVTVDVHDDTSYRRYPADDQQILLLVHLGRGHEQSRANREPFPAARGVSEQAEWGLKTLNPCAQV